MIFSHIQIVLGQNTEAGCIPTLQKGTINFIFF